MRIFGIDAGIASVGWAVLEGDTHPTQIIAAGTWMFDAPETPKERTPTNAIRRQKRGQRRVVRRRRQRMAAIRTLLAQHALLPSSAPHALATGLNPWALRAAGLDKLLTPTEFATILGHIAKHRGFRSNAKATSGTNAASETSKMKAAIAKTSERLSKWRTVGEGFAKDHEFADRKRNRDGSFTHSILRAEQEHEIRLLFRKQAALGNPAACENLLQAYTKLAFSQRPLQDSHHLVGPCNFEKGEKRTARRAPPFERFRLYTRLANLRIIESSRATRSAQTERALTAAEITLAAQDFGLQKKLSYHWLRGQIDLAERAAFVGIPVAEEKKLDIVARTGHAAEGTAALRDAIGPAPWRSLLPTPEILDTIAEILTFRSDLGSIRTGLLGLGLEPLIATALVEAAEAGKFSAFSGAGHISAKAARTLLPALQRGLSYTDACAEVGYDHAAQAEANPEAIKNPVARKAISEVLKQVRAMVQHFGLPDLMHVELARDIGKSAEERDEITKGIEKRNSQRDKFRDRFTELVGRPPKGADEMLRYELWEEQGHRCLYTDEAIKPTQLVATDNSVQVDHILPWSRFGDDSFNNKTLCLASANANKRGRTPYEWFTADKTPADFAAYERRVETCNGMKGYKKRGHYLRRNAAEVEERFRTRNLNDTRYATRVVLEQLKRHYPRDDKVHVQARPGALTDKLRRGWGLQGLKKTPDGKRIQDDRHHALDAIVVAACSQSMLNSLTRAFQKAEREGRARDFSALDQPWDGFRSQAHAAFESVFVARAERHRARGEAHAATIRQVRERNGKLVIFDRKSIDNLTLKDMPNIKDADRNAAIIQSLTAWIEAGKPKDEPPLSPKGDIIRKVRVASTDKPAIEIRGGTAARGEMARVDVFSKPSKGRPRFFLVPVYPHEVASNSHPPNRAIDAGKDEKDWTVMDHTYNFLFSIYSHTLLSIVKPDGEIITGYFKGVNRALGAINLSAHNDLDDKRTNLGARTLLGMSKFQVDRLGRKYEVRQEVRTWHGVACT